VLTNLVVNALTYSPPTEPVIVRTTGENETVIVEVHNGGVPIAPALVPHLFEPYRRGESERVSNSSLGLGLFISREIVAAHRGSIDVRSSSEEGTTFTVRIPRTSRDMQSRR
jgi:signal transduction histidine kinase